MTKKFYIALGLLALGGCSTPPSPVPSTGAPTPLASAALPSPLTAHPIDDSEIRAAKQLIDDQIADGLLTSKEITDGGKQILAWRKGDDIQRIDVTINEVGTQELDVYYFEKGRVFYFGGQGRRSGADDSMEDYAFGAAITPEGKIVGTPFERQGSRTGPYSEDIIRLRKTFAQDLLTKVSQPARP